MVDPLPEIGARTIAAFLLVLARVGPLFLFAPAISSQALPPRAKGVAAVALAIGLTPFALHGQHLPLDAVSLGVLMAKELLVGLAFAYAVGAVVAAASVAGTVLDSVVGYAFASLVDPVHGTSGGPLGQLYGLVTAVVFLAVDGDHWLIQGLARTYELVPLHELPSFVALAGGVEQAFAGIFPAALEVAAPVLLAVTVTDIGFGMLSRVVPQMNIFSVGFPAKILIALAVLIVSLPFAAGWFIDASREAAGAAANQIGSP
ncbi:MAG TPA: flagellar biosynthetic protein FliR [Solirubrobacteraceae bacterium]|nr:flagellar biosynthetic protein FliR [Solirubrobacteraceae bacterium]